MLKETAINDKNNTKVIAKLHQGHSKVKIAKKYPLFLKFNTISGAINYYKDWFWDIIGQTYFPHTFSRYWGQCQPWEGYHTLIPLIMLISQWLIERAKSHRAAVWNISLGYHGKISIHNWVMKVHIVWNCVLLGYRLKTTYISRSRGGQTGKNPKNMYFYYLQPRWPLEIQHSFEEYVSDR